MDASRFDTLARSLSAVGSRRRAVALALAGAAGLWGRLDRTEVAAHDALPACKKKKGKQKKRCLKKAKQHNASHPPGGGTGNCTACPTPANPCQFATCTNGTCGTANRPVGFSCADGNFCNGVETCDGLGNCRPGTDPCDDGDVCTTDFCDEATKECTHQTICAPELQEVTVDPKPVSTATPSSGTVRLDRPADGDTEVTLTVDKPLNASVPVSVTVASGQTTGSFNVTGLSPTAGDPVTLTASLNVVSVTDTFDVVNPGP